MITAPTQNTLPALIAALDARESQAKRQQAMKRQAAAERRYSCPCCGNDTKQENSLCGRCLYF